MTKEVRTTGKVWVFRWREFGQGGDRIHRKMVVGTVEKYKTRTAAEKAVAGLRLDLSKEAPEQVKQSITVEQLATHYEEKELGEGSNKAYSTQQCYKQYLQKWIAPRWGHYLISEVRTVAVESWLRSLLLADGTKAKIRNIMHVLFTHALRYEWLDRNPIDLVRQSAKRQKAPTILTVGELKALLSELQEPYRTMVFLVAATGLRVSELLALKWRDFDFEKLEINLSRAVVHQVVGEMKTEASRKPVPLDTDLAESLLELRASSPFNQPDDWLFASPEKKGEQPYWPENPLRRHIRPAALRCGIRAVIGFHTFRHTFASLLKANGEDIKVVQESLRHANSRITLDTYTQAMNPAKREAQSKVVRMILPGGIAAEASGT